MTLENENLETKSIKTIIVEDEIIIARDIKQTLEKAGHEVIRMFMSGEEAAKKIPSLSADVILMDVYLKGPLDGIEVAEILSLSANIPIVFITGHSEHTIISRIKFTQNYGVVLKPFNSNTLLTTVELAYRNHKKKNRLNHERQNPGYAGRMENLLEDLKAGMNTDDQLNDMLSLLKDINSDFHSFIDDSKFIKENINLYQHRGLSLNKNHFLPDAKLPILSDSLHCAHESKSSIVTMINYADHILNDYDNLSLEEIKKFAAKISVFLKMLYAE